MKINARQLKELIYDLVISSFSGRVLGRQEGGGSNVDL